MFTTANAPVRPSARSGSAGQYRDILGIELDLRAYRRHDADSLTKDNAHHPQLVLRRLGAGLP